MDDLKYCDISMLWDEIYEIKVELTFPTKYLLNIAQSSIKRKPKSVLKT